jgi:hypothetical protein
MPFKPNYRQQRADRNRAKDQKKQEKLQRREEKVAERRAAKDASEEPVGGQDEPAASAGEG